VDWRKKFHVVGDQVEELRKVLLHERTVDALYRLKVFLVAHGNPPPSDGASSAKQAVGVNGSFWWKRSRWPRREPAMGRHARSRSLAPKRRGPSHNHCQYLARDPPHAPRAEILLRASSYCCSASACVSAIARSRVMSGRISPTCFSFMRRRMV